MKNNSFTRYLNSEETGMDYLVNLYAKKAYRQYVAGTESEQLISLDDLKHAGVIGYLEAESRFDHKRGVDQRTFLGYRVRGAIIDWLRKQPMVSLPQGQYSRVKALRECREHLMKTGSEATDEQLAACLHWNVDEVQKTRALKPYVRSLDKQKKEEGGCELDLLPDRGLQPLDSVIEKEVAQLIDICLKNLPSSEDRLILIARMQREIKLKQLAMQFGCSPQAIHQREKRALEKMKECLLAHGWAWEDEEN